MPNPFPDTDVARLVALPMPVRLLALLVTFRFLGETELTLTAPDHAETMTDFERDGLILRFARTVDPIAGTRSHVYALRRPGAVTLAKMLNVALGSVPSETPASCRKSMFFLDHTLARNRFALLLARDLARPDAPAKLLSWEHDADRLADAAHPLQDGALRRVPLVADGLAIIEGPRGVEALLVEIDRGTERPGYLARKFAGYATWWRESGPERRFDVRALRVLFVAPNAKRADQLRTIAQEAVGLRLGGLFWFAAENELLAGDSLATIWTTVRNREPSGLWIRAASRRTS